MHYDCEISGDTNFSALETCLRQHCPGRDIELALVDPDARLHDALDRLARFEAGIDDNAILTDVAIAGQDPIWSVNERLVQLRAR